MEVPHSRELGANIDANAANKVKVALFRLLLAIPSTEPEEPRL